MTVVFLTNFLTHHQVPFCNEMYKQFGEDFSLVVMRSTDSEQKKLGYQELNDMYPYVVRTYDGADQEKRALELCDQADVVIWGSAPAKYTERRLRENKLTLVYTERLFKKGMWRALYPPMLKSIWNKYTAKRKKNQYYLCASAYTAPDINFFTRTPRKFFKWGYFPPTKVYDDVEKVINEKDPRSIVWVARYIDWKHPEVAVEIGKRLKRDGYNATITMLGNGVMLDEISQKVKDEQLENVVRILGGVPSEKVRSYMEKSEIHLFTSDRNEGWGAVLNESMNSACAVVANKKIGSARFLISNGENGFVYKDVNELYKKLTFLLDHPETTKELGRRAYTTITGAWNAKTATRRLIELMERMLDGEYDPVVVDGPCSSAM